MLCEQPPHFQRMPALRDLIETELLSLLWTRFLFVLLRSGAGFAARIDMLQLNGFVHDLTL